MTGGPLCAQREECTVSVAVELCREVGSQVMEGLIFTQLFSGQYAQNTSDIKCMSLVPT